MNYFVCKVDSLVQGPLKTSSLSVHNGTNKVNLLKCINVSCKFTGNLLFRFFSSLVYNNKISRYVAITVDFKILHYGPGEHIPTYIPADVCITYSISEVNCDSTVQPIIHCNFSLIGST